MNVLPLLTNAAATTSAPLSTDDGVFLVNPINAADGRDEFIVQVDLSGTATVRLFGKLGSGRQWVQLGPDITASGAYAFARFPQVTAQVSAFTSGTVNVLAGI